MRKNNKKALYESIMRKISRVVKAELNEARGMLGMYVPQVVDMFNEFYHDNLERLEQHIALVKASNEYNDFETRIAYDIARVLKYWSWDFIENADVNDSVIKTLLVLALRQSDIPYDI